MGSAYRTHLPPEVTAHTPASKRGQVLSHRGSRAAGQEMSPAAPAAHGFTSFQPSQAGRRRDFTSPAAPRTGERTFVATTVE